MSASKYSARPKQKYAHKIYTEHHRGHEDIMIIRAAHARYDLSSSDDVHHLKANILTLIRNKNQRLLTKIHSQVAQYEGYTGDDAALKRASVICNMTGKALVELAGSIGEYVEPEHKSEPSPKKSPRKIRSYDDNETCSLSVPRHTGQVYGHLEKSWEEIEHKLEASGPGDFIGIASQSLKLLEEFVKEHAARRVDLFFLLLIAVYNTHLNVTKGDTVEQHGGGSVKKRGTNACHSSLFPAVNLEGDSALTLKGTHFAKELNSTVELPCAVNGYDGHLEGRIMQSALVANCVLILNKVSSGEITPWVGMDEFFVAIFKFLTNSKFESYFENDGKTTSSQIKRTVHEYECKGTFWAATPDKKHVSPKYVCGMLGIYDEAKIKEAAENPKLAEIEDQYVKIQEQIYSFKE